VIDCDTASRFNGIETMTDEVYEWPVWDYWLYDEQGGYIYDYPAKVSRHPDAEFLDGTDYENEWTLKFHWTADEAAALSFGRSPNKVPYDRYMEEMDGSSEFATHFCALRRHIMQSQKDGHLPDLILARMYSYWAIKQGIPFPTQLAEAVETFFNRAMGIDSVGVAKADDSRAAIDIKRKVASEQVDDDDHEPLSRRESTLLSILYGLAWKHYGLGKGSTSITGIATNMEKVLDRLRENNVHLEGKVKTIAKRLSEAVGEFGKPPEKDP
jgi:hypothetical protein